MARDKDYPEQIWCDGCGVEILWSPVIVGNRDHCCQDCADGLPCRCGERMELDERRRGHSAESSLTGSSLG